MKSEGEAVTPATAVEKNAKPTPRSPDGKRLGGVTGKGFMPGQSGCPGGRPKKQPLTRALEAQLGDPAPNDPKGLTRAQKIADALIKLAERGNVPAAKEIADRVEGKVPQALTGAEGSALIPGSLAQAAVVIAGMTPEELEDFMRVRPGGGHR